MDSKVIWGYSCKAGPLLAVEFNGQEIPTPVSTGSRELEPEEGLPCLHSTSHAALN